MTMPHPGRRSGGVSREQFEVRRYEFHKEMEEDFFAVYEVKSAEPYCIKNGDNVWTLCIKKFGLPFWLLKKYNSEMDFYCLFQYQHTAKCLFQNQVVYPGPQLKLLGLAYGFKISNKI